MNTLTPGRSCGEYQKELLAKTKSDFLDEARAAAALGRKRLIRMLFAASGLLCTGLGLLGIFLPILPTTPFLLLAAACFIRSSDRLYFWLMNNSLFGSYLCRYRAGDGLPLSFKVWTILLLWISLSLSALLAIPERIWWVRLLLLGVGVGVTIHLLCIKTYTKLKS